MNLYLVVPEVKDVDGKRGTDLVSGHMDELMLFQNESDADLEAYRINERFPRAVHRMTVLELEVN